MADQWTEHIPGVFWTQPIEADTLKPKLDELGLIAKSTTVLAYKDFRYVMGQDPQTGGLVMLVATGDDQMSAFRGSPV